MRKKYFNRVSTKVPKVVDKDLSDALDVLTEAQNAWLSLEEVRKKLKRSVMFSLEDQWGDVIYDPDTNTRMKESEYLKKQGKAPLKNNMIRPIVKNIDGQFRQNQTKPVCVVRDRNESKLGEMMSIAIEYSHQLNECQELDASALTSLVHGGMIAQRVEYGYNDAKQLMDTWVYNVNPFRLFFNTNIEDVRGWDTTIIGELMDLPLKDVIAKFADTKERRNEIESIYGNRSYSYYTQNGMTGTNNDLVDFVIPTDPSQCRVILVWKKESRECYFFHDYFKGEWWYGPESDVDLVEAENKRRISEGSANGVLEEDISLIDYKWATEQYWYYRYMTPTGKVLKEGRSPYWHKEHNYVLHLYQMVHGKIYNFIEDFIDQQKAINRTLTMIDFMRGASAKGLVVVDEDAFIGMSKEEIIDQYVRYNGVLFCQLKPGKSIDSVLKQYHGQANMAGDYELLNLQLKLINDISGVNSAMQGKAPASGTPSSLYAQQVENSSLNLKGLLESFKAFRRKRDIKLMKTDQQYYTSARYLDLAGNDYSDESKWYDPKKVQDAEIDVYISDGSNTPMYQMVMNDFLMELYKGQAISVKQLLENSSLPFATKILESIKRDEQEMEAAQQQQRMAMPQGVPQEYIA